jgi:hypothetical protein
VAIVFHVNIAGTRRHELKHNARQSHLKLKQGTKRGTESIKSTPYDKSHCSGQDHKATTTIETGAQLPYKHLSSEVEVLFPILLLVMLSRGNKKDKVQGLLLVMLSRGNKKDKVQGKTNPRCRHHPII